MTTEESVNELVEEAREILRNLKENFSDSTNSTFARRMVEGELSYRVQRRIMMAMDELQNQGEVN